MNNRFDFIKREVTIVSDEYSYFNNPISLKQGGFMMCINGEIEVVSNMKKYNMRGGDIISAFPNTIVQLLNANNEFKGIILSIDVDFILNIPITNKRMYHLNIVDNPCISLTGAETDKILSLCKMLIGNDNENHPFKDEINENISKVIVYEIASAYGTRTPIVSQKRTRDEMIFDKFIFQLYTDYKEYRRLNYYAALQQITPIHLSRAVKRASGFTAAEWVIKCIIYNIKLCLYNESIPIYKIAEEFNFPNDSFFSQYFKKHSGQTPREFRKNNL